VGALRAIVDKERDVAERRAQRQAARGASLAAAGASIGSMDSELLLEEALHVVGEPSHEKRRMGGKGERPSVRDVASSAAATRPLASSLRASSPDVYHYATTSGPLAGDRGLASTRDSSSLVYIGPAHRSSTLQASSTFHVDEGTMELAEGSEIAGGRGSSAARFSSSHWRDSSGSSSSSALVSSVPDASHTLAAPMQPPARLQRASVLTSSRLDALRPASLHIDVPSLTATESLDPPAPSPSSVQSPQNPYIEKHKMKLRKRESDAMEGRKVATRQRRVSKLWRTAAGSHAKLSEEEKAREAAQKRATARKTASKLGMLRLVGTLFRSSVDDTALNKAPDRKSVV